MKTHLFEYIKKKRGNRAQLTNKFSPFNPTSIIKLLIINLYTLIIIFSLSSCGVDLDEDNGVKTMAAGQYHTVALKNDGTVWAWGQNNHGRLGDGTTAQKDSPVQVVGENGIGVLEDVIAVSAGSAHTVALKNDGTLLTWGQNNQGQLGNDDYDTTNIPHPFPAQVVGENGVGVLKDVIAVSAGSTHTVALKKDGTLYAWGYNSSGQLGDGTTTTRRNSPVPVVGESGAGVLKDVIAVSASASASHTLAIDKNGKLWAWGNNNYGQLGNDEGPTDYSSYAYDKNTPVRVVGGESGTTYLEDVIAVSVGAQHTVALKKDGTVWAWGENRYGKLGDGSKTTYLRVTSPLQEAREDKDWIAIFTGYAHTVALKKNGTIWTWGQNTYGQLGLGDKGNNPRNIPTRLGEAADLVGVSGGFNHSIALRRSGILWTWGDNEYGQLGLGDSGAEKYRLRPTAVKWP